MLLDVKSNPIEEATTHDQLIVNHMNSTPYEVDLIMCMPEFDFQKPPSLKELTSFKHQRHPRLGYVIFIGRKTNSLVRFLMTTVAVVRRLKMQSFETLDEALAFIGQMRNLKV